MSAEAKDLEPVDDFRARAAAWARDHLPRKGTGDPGIGKERVRHSQHLQSILFDGGFAGITWPTQYGGQGLTVAHMRALDEALTGYDVPYRELSVSVGILGPTLMDHGTEDQKDRFLKRLLRGDDLWVQLFSEPTGGSDLAGATTRATRDGDTYVINGSKVWTTFGHYADYGVCLCRTDWSVPKHRGLSMLIVKMDSPGLTIVPLKQANGNAEFCQEFLDDVLVPAANLLGTENDGWNMANAVLSHERNALGGGSRWFSMGATAATTSDGGRDLAAVARASGTWSDPWVRDAVVEAHVNAVIGAQLGERVKTGVVTGAMQGPVGSVLKLFTAAAHLRQTEVEVAVRGPGAAAWKRDASATKDTAMGYVGRQGGSLAGGSDEIQRNIVSERVLGLPREHAPDKDLPFDQVRRNKMAARPDTQGA